MVNINKYYCMTCKQLFNYENVNRNVLDIREPEFWKWIIITLFDETKKSKQIIQYNKRKYTYIINCPHCLSMNTINTAPIENDMINKPTKIFGHYTKDKKKLYMEIMTKLKEKSV